MTSENVFVSFAAVCLMDFQNINNQADLIQEYNIRPDFTIHENKLFCMIVSLLKRYFNYQKTTIPKDKDEKILLILGLGKPNFDFLDKNYCNFHEQDSSYQFSNESAFLNFINFSLDIEIKKEFPMIDKTIMISASCVTGIYAVYLGIQNLDEYDKCIIICAEKSKNDLLISAYRNMGVLSANGVMRPFSKERDGFVLGEGAGFMVLKKDNDKTNYKNYLGRIKGINIRNDGFDIVRYKNEGENISNAIKDVLEHNNLYSSDIDYVNAHGTATLYNDLIETLVYKRIFGSQINNVYISSVKPFIGHCLSASGLIETIFSFISLKYGYIFPTMNCLGKDDSCDLNYVFEKGINIKIKNFIKVSLGFGGTIGVIIGGASE